MKNKMKYGFIIPLKSEANFLLRRIKIIKKINLSQRQIILASLNKNNIAIIISGCGKIRTASATQLLIDRFRPKFLIHYGSAGGISPKVEIGNIVCATEVIEHDVEVLFPNKLPPPIYKVNKAIINKIKKIKSLDLVLGRIISGDKDVINTREKQKLFERYKALSVDWESAAFLSTCQLNKYGAFILRGITDLAYENTAEEYKNNEKKVMQILTDKLLKIINKI